MTLQMLCTIFPRSSPNAFCAPRGREGLEGESHAAEVNVSLFAVLSGCQVRRNRLDASSDAVLEVLQEMLAGLAINLGHILYVEVW